MKIIHVGIKNYKNLDGVNITLHPHINFLVGENDMGKSNFLSMLDIVLNHKRFIEDDFFDESKPIEIEMSLLLDEIEKGIFEDYFTPDNDKTINIIAKQETPDELIKYIHKESEGDINSTQIRCINFIKYDSLRTPKEELTFYKNRGVGKFLGYLIERLITDEASGEDKEYLNKVAIAPIVDDINKKLEKIKMFKEHKINAAFEENVRELIYKIITIKDSKGFDIQKVGYGVQFSALIILSILEKLMVLIEDKRQSSSIFEKDGKKSVSLILGMDEPEIHLHPYKQRSLVKYVHKLLNNSDAEFALLIKELFNLDNICGQAIVVSHSPNIILDDYKHIVRFYSKESKVDVVSGGSIELVPNMEKHLLMNFPYIKEALFSKCAILVEGFTELGALPVWIVEELGAIDEYGITVVGAGGGRSVAAIMRVLDALKIPNLGIIDRDIYEGSKEQYDAIQNLFVTEKQDFEQELVETVIASGRQDVLFELINEYEKTQLDFYVKRDRLYDIATNKYGIEIPSDGKDAYTFKEIKDSENVNLIKAMFLAWLNIRAKNIILGRFIGERIKKELIPTKYAELIRKAKNMTGC